MLFLDCIITLLRQKFQIQTVNSVAASQLRTIPGLHPGVLACMIKDRIMTAAGTNGRSRKRSFGE